MATKTKNKLSKALKNTLINELKDKKEEERLERVKQNANLREITIWTDKTNKVCQNYIDFLTSEGVNLIIKDRKDNQKEWNKVASITNYNAVPTFFTNGEYLSLTRDFHNQQQILNALKYLGNPDYNNPTYDAKILEHLKTNQYNLFTKLNQIQQQLSPIATFISNLQKELTEEENEEIKTKKEGDCGCGKNKNQNKK